MTTNAMTPRQYGQWRAGRRAGIAGLGPAATVVALFGLAVVVGIAGFSTLGAVIAAIIGLLLLGPLAIRFGGRTGAQILACRLAWWMSLAKRRTIYISGIASKVVGEHRLPGILANSHVYGVENGRGGYTGIIALPGHRHYTLVLRSEADGVDLVDQNVIEQRVARYAAWLASLGREPDLVQAQVVVDTTPDPGTGLRNEITSTMAPGAPALAVKVLNEVATTYPKGSTQVDVYIALTYRKATTPDPYDAARDVATRAAVVRHTLAGTGASGIRAATPDDLIRLMRSAYDPAETEAMHATPANELSWDQAGPVAAHHTWDTYHHDSAWSRTWGMQEAPRGAVVAKTFARLTDPIPGLRRKRVTLIYYPCTPDEAARIVETDKRDASFNYGKKARPSARDAMDVAATKQAAVEEATGAGVERFTLLATVTVDDEAHLAEASRQLLARAGQTRFRLRVMHAQQDTAFAASLPAGIVLPDHATIPIGQAI